MMKTIADFQAKCKILFAARAKLPALLRDLDKSREGLQQQIESVESVVNLFRECEVTKSDGIFFESYLDAQDAIRVSIKDFNGAITRYNEIESNKKTFIPYLPLYTLRCTAADEKSYEEYSKLIAQEYLFETRAFKCTSYPDKFWIEIEGDVRDSIDFFKDIFEEKFSEYCSFVVESQSASRSSSILSTEVKTTPVSSTASTDELCDVELGFHL